MDKRIYVVNGIIPEKKRMRYNKLTGKRTETERPIPTALDPVVTEIKLEQGAITLEFKKRIGTGIRSGLVLADVRRGHHMSNTFPRAI